MTYAEFRKRYQWNAKTDKLGEGGFGKVYRATDTLRNRLVVLKIADVPVDHKFSLQREVDLNRDLSAHPNIVQYRNCYRLEDEYGEERDYATMDYFNEGSLTTVMKRRPLTEADKHDIIVGILQGLSHLEREKVIHRDFKPGNVLMVRSDSGSWLPKIADFGLSRFSNNEATETNSSIGISYDYAAPEQFRAGNINQQADLWAAGVIFYQLLTGELPFAVQPDLIGESRRLELIRRIEQAELPARLNHLTEPYQTLIRRCLVKELSSRVKSSNELLDLVAESSVRSVSVLPGQDETDTIIQVKPVSVQHEEVKPVTQTKPVPDNQEGVDTVLRSMTVEDQPGIATLLTTPVNITVESGETALDWEQKVSHKKNRFLVFALVIGLFCLAGSYFIWQRVTNQSIQSRYTFDARPPGTSVYDSVIPNKPIPPRLVNDFVDIVPFIERDELEEHLRRLSEEGTAQIALVIVKTTAPYSIKDFAVVTGKKWGVGEKDKNNGIVIAWATQDRKIFIATGYGIEKVLPDSTVKSIIDLHIIPKFRQEKYYQGLSDGVDAIVREIRNKTATDVVSKIPVSNPESTYTSVISVPDFYYEAREPGYIKTSVTEKAVRKVSAYLADHSDKRISIIGHTDNDGSEDVNLEWSWQKAKLIQKVFIDAGVNPGQTEIDAKGETEPKADNSIEKGRRANRRVTVVIL